MGVWRFNVPEPSCQPTHAPRRFPVSSTGGRCGNCHCVPPAWELVAPDDAGQDFPGSPSSPHVGRWLLERVPYGSGDDGTSAWCEWQTRERTNDGVDLSSGEAVWTLFYGLIMDSSGGHAPGHWHKWNGWQIWAGAVSFAGGGWTRTYYVPGRLIPAGGIVKPSGHLWPFRCLHEQEFLFINALQSSQYLGPHVTIRPFWR